jgi:hypothetical protein
MSTLRVDAIRHNSATSDAITTAADGTCTAKLTSVGGSGLSHRNIIINGAMNVAQYGTSASNTGGTTARSVDRFFAGNPSASAVQTFSQETDAPAGFYYSAKATCTTALTSYGTNAQSKIEYRIEGTDLAHVQLGTSNAQTLSVSFYVKSNKTGNTAIGLINQNNDRSFVHQYTIASANTWQRVSFKVVGDTTGTWLKDTNVGMRMRWGTFGTDYQTGTFDAWQSGQKMATSNSPINFNSATGDYIQITGVQVELGDTATSFEHRSYDEELKRCKRYALVIGSNQAIGTGSAYNSTNININIYNQFRATPTYSKTTGGNGYTWVVYVGASGVATASPTVTIASDSKPNYCLRLYVQNCHNSLTAGQAVWALTHDGGGEQIVFSAEL